MSLKFSLNAEKKERNLSSQDEHRKFENLREAEMERGEKVRERGNKKEELLGVKLKRGILVGKRGGNSTPSPTWRFGLAQTDASPLQNLTFPPKFTRTKSARELAANLWEIQPQLEVGKMSKGGPRPHHHKHKDKGFELPNQFDEPPDSPDDQPTTSRNLRKHVTDSSMQHHESVERNGVALQPASPRSSGSIEVAPCRMAMSPAGSLQLKGRFRESSYDLKTSTELLRVLNRIWNLEEQHISNISLVKAMNKELDTARAQIKALLKEKKRYDQKMDDLMKQLSEDKAFRRNEEQDQIQEAIKSMRKELEDERKLRKHSENLHRKLARELSEVKSSFSNALKELERERKARILLEDLCDEFAKGIRDYEQEIRVLKHKSEKDFTVQEHNDRLILHISEAWLDARMQIKLAEAHSGLEDKKMVLDKLSLEIETFLQAKHSVFYEGNDTLSSRKLKDSTLPRSSLESFHLNEAGSAPQNGNEEEDSINSGLYCSEIKRGSKREERNGSTYLDLENAQNNHLKKTLKSNYPKRKDQSREVAKDAGLSILQMQFKENMFGDFSCNGCQPQLGDGKAALTRRGTPVELNATQKMFVDELVQKSSTGEKKKEMEIQNLLHNNLTRDHIQSSEFKKSQHDHKHADNSFDPSSLTGHGSSVERWTSKVITPDPGASETSSRWPQGIKENTLKAKLLEARRESQQSRSRASKG